MDQLNTVLGSLVIIVLQIGLLLAFLFFCLTPIKTKTLKRFTLLTLVFIFYNVFYQVNEIQLQNVRTVHVLYLLTILLLFLSAIYFVAQFIQQYGSSSTFKAIIILCCVFPVLLVASTIVQKQFSLRNVLAIFYTTLPIVLSVLTATLFFFYKGLSRKNQSRAMLSSGLLLAASLTFYILLERYNRGLHFTTVNLNYSVLAIFVVAIHRRSFLIHMYNGKKNANVDPDLVEHLKRYNLTNRQIEIAQHIIDGKSYNEIAEDCHLALNTVTKHASNIFKKLEVRDKQSFLNKLN